MHLVRIGYQFVAGLIILTLFILNLRLYAPGSAAYSPTQLGPDVIPQLNFIGAALRRGAGEHMQDFFPEGFFFTHVLYGLTWVEVGLRVPAGTSLHKQALEESAWALARLDSPTGRVPFSAGLDPPYGIFYVGWINWLRGGILMLQPAESRLPHDVDRFRADCVAIEQAFNRSTTPFLSAYPGQAWPVDNVVALAVLRLHDALFPPRFDHTIQDWLRAAQQRLDPQTGLLPHRVDPKTGERIEGTRGSSQSLILRFLIEIEPTWGRTQYALFREQFVVPFLGAPGVKEYPMNVRGQGDIDSGPLIAGFSASATVVMIGAAQVYGDREVADALIQAGEAVGLPFDWGNTKRYAFGLLPVGDAFLVWAKTSRPWITDWTTAELPSVVNRWWRLRLHGATLFIVVLLWLPIRCTTFLTRRRTHAIRRRPLP